MKSSVKGRSRTKIEEAAVKILWRNSWLEWISSKWWPEKQSTNKVVIEWPAVYSTRKMHSITHNFSSGVCRWVDKSFFTPQASRLSSPNFKAPWLPIRSGGIVVKRFVIWPSITWTTLFMVILPQTALSLWILDDKAFTVLGQEDIILAHKNYSSLKNRAG